jgi:hypothetical protein
MIFLRKRTAWLVWTILLLVFLFMAGYIMDGVSKMIIQKASSPKCAITLDLKMGFSNDEVFQSLNCMGNEARGIYRRALTREDIFYPICYVLFFTFTVVSLATYLLKQLTLVLGMAIISLSILVFDVLENYYIVLLIDQFPNLDEDVLSSAALFNTLKWNTLVITLSMIFFLAVLGLIKAVSRKRIRSRSTF